jgi:rhomboid family GlyGly-CTERM serine protease
MSRLPPNPSFFPWVTAVVCSASILATLHARAATALQYDAHRVFTGEWYRLLTCHLPHWTTNHLGWSLVTFAVLCSLCEIRGQLRTLCCTMASAVLIPLSLLWAQPSLITYRGLSGIDSALFVLLAVQLLRTTPAVARIVTLALVAFVGKAIFEMLTGGTLFANPAGRFVPVPLAHLTGAVVGLACATIPPPLTAARHYSPTTLISTRLARRPSNSP